MVHHKLGLLVCVVAMATKSHGFRDAGAMATSFVFVNHYFRSTDCSLNSSAKYAVVEPLEIGCTRDPAGGYRYIEYDPYVDQNVRQYREGCPDETCLPASACRSQAEGPFEVGSCSLVAGNSTEQESYVIIYGRRTPCFGPGNDMFGTNNTAYSVEYQDDNCRTFPAKIRHWSVEDAGCDSQSGAPGTFYDMDIAVLEPSGKLNCTNNTCEDCMYEFSGPWSDCLSSGEHSSLEMWLALENCANMSPTLPPSPPNNNPKDTFSKYQTAIVMASTLSGAAILWLALTLIFCRKRLSNEPINPNPVGLNDDNQRKPNEYSSLIEG